MSAANVRARSFAGFIAADLVAMRDYGDDRLTDEERQQRLAIGAGVGAVGNAGIAALTAAYRAYKLGKSGAGAAAGVARPSVNRDSSALPQNDSAGASTAEAIRNNAGELGFTRSDDAMPTGEGVGARDIQHEKRGIYNVHFNEKTSTIIRRDADEVVKALMYEMGRENPVTKKGYGDQHIIKHTVDPSAKGFVTTRELLGMGDIVRSVEPRVEANGLRVYEKTTEDGTMFRVIVGDKHDGNERVISFYSDRNVPKEATTSVAINSTFGNETIPQKPQFALKPAYLPVPAGHTPQAVAAKAINQKRSELANTLNSALAKMKDEAGEDWEAITANIFNGDRKMLNNPETADPVAFGRLLNGIQEELKGVRRMKAEREEILRSLRSAQNDKGGVRNDQIAGQARNDKVGKQFKEAKTHPRYEEMMGMREDIKATQTKSENVRDFRATSLQTDDGYKWVRGGYSHNYASDFRLTKAQVKRIREGKATEQDKRDLLSDLKTIDTHPTWSDDAQSLTKEIGLLREQRDSLGLNPDQKAELANLEARLERRNELIKKGVVVQSNPNAGGAIVGAQAGWEKDENGRWRFNPAKAAVGAAAGLGAARVMTKGQALKPANPLYAITGKQERREIGNIGKVLRGEKPSTIIRKDEAAIKREAEYRKADAAEVEKAIAFERGREKRGIGFGAVHIEKHLDEGAKGFVTPVEVMSIGKVIREGKFSVNDGKHIYTLTKEDGTNLYAIVGFKDMVGKKGERTISFYSDRNMLPKVASSLDTLTSSSGGKTANIPQLPALVKSNAPKTTTTTVKSPISVGSTAVGFVGGGLSGENGWDSERAIIGAVGGYGVGSRFATRNLAKTYSAITKTKAAFDDITGAKGTLRRLFTNTLNDEYLAARGVRQESINAESIKLERLHNALKELPENERIALHEFLQGDRAAVPAHLQTLAGDMRKTIDDLSKELVGSGVLSKEAYDEWVGKYLHRSYEKHLGFMGAINNLRDIPSYLRGKLGNNSHIPTIMQRGKVWVGDQSEFDLLMRQGKIGRVADGLIEAKSLSSGKQPVILKSEAMNLKTNTDTSASPQNDRGASVQNDKIADHVRNDGGGFGTIYTQFRGKPNEAIAHLMKTKEGEAVGALYHKDVGEIDLVWGVEGTGKSDGYGLSKIVKFHPEVLNDLQGILSSMKVVSKSENRIRLESVSHTAGIRLDYDGKSKTWLMTAFEKRADPVRRTDIDGRSINDRVEMTQLPQLKASTATIPQKLASGKYQFRRDWTKAEREQMGEVTDAAYTLPETLLRLNVMKHNAAFLKEAEAIGGATLDEAAAKALGDQLGSQGWARVPDNLKYGVLANKVVRKDVLDDINSFNDAVNQTLFGRSDPLSRAWLGYLGAWKKSKTIWNAPTHMNNFNSNLFLMHLAGMKTNEIATSLGRAAKTIYSASRYEALHTKAILGRLSAAEKAEYNKIGTAIADFVEAKSLGVFGRSQLNDILRGHMVGWTKAGKLGKLDEFAQKLYQGEDNINRLAAYSFLRRTHNMSAAQAKEFVLKLMPDYTQPMPAGIRALRDSGIAPFISWSYYTVPTILRLMKTKQGALQMAKVIGSLSALEAIVGVNPASNLPFVSGDKPDDFKARRVAIAKQGDTVQPSCLPLVMTSIKILSWSGIKQVYALDRQNAL
ncbi:hypothetical protein AGMMS50229_07020 [Campylobacterota bacterium]|nr:hypothetical protein AGMMS50229_07020 [Campylobacterota bacterium]